MKLDEMEQLDESFQKLTRQQLYTEEHFQLPTIEGSTSRLTGAKVYQNQMQTMAIEKTSLDEDSHFS